ATTTITWSNPADITYLTALSGTQLNATASVAGSFAYSPAAGIVLNAGNNQTLHVDFTPTDTANYNAASQNVAINVLKATPAITWGNPADIDQKSVVKGKKVNATVWRIGIVDYTRITLRWLNVGNNHTRQSQVAAS